MNAFKSGFAMIQDVIKLKWIPEILSSIGNGHYGFQEILDSIPYLSAVELNRKLKVLQERGIIHKLENGEYKLRPFGDDLLHILLHLQDLNERYNKEAV